jgi:segregation and condensation protein A
VTHLHAPAVSVREQVAVLVQRLRRAGSTTFRALIADCSDTLTVVARFLGLLELYREAEVTFEQATPFGELHVRWTGSADGEFVVGDEFDGADGEPVVDMGDEAGG